ncbi:MAG: glycosyltransferase, partial [Flavobacteriales bacterium]
MADFTIVTPVLNQASTIEACIQSVANQDVNVEHIIIDGGSTDGTVDIIKKYG